MPKTKSYHESAIKYNELLAASSKYASEAVEDEEVKKWCLSIMRQHEFHARRHQLSLEKLLKSESDAALEVEKEEVN